MKKKTIHHIILASLIGNMLLTTIKLTFGYLGHSKSLISDGYNSLSDILVSILLMIFMHVSTKKADKNHPYGHEKFEGVLYLLLSMILLITAFLIGYEGVADFIQYLNHSTEVVMPEKITMYAAIVSVVIKGVLFVINRRAAKKFNSSSLQADAKNHFFDIVATTASLIGIVLALLYGWIYFEAIASILISIMILCSSISMSLEAISFLVDEAPEEAVFLEMKTIILSCEGVMRIDDLKARKHMTKLYVDVEIAVKKELSLKEAHEIAERVHHKMEDSLDVVHCMVHVNPL